MKYSFSWLIQRAVDWSAFIPKLRAFIIHDDGSFDQSSVTKFPLKKQMGSSSLFHPFSASLFYGFTNVLSLSTDESEAYLKKLCSLSVDMNMKMNCLIVIFLCFESSSPRRILFQIRFPLCCAWKFIWVCHHCHHHRQNVKSELQVYASAWNFHLLFKE